MGRLWARVATRTEDRLPREIWVLIGASFLIAMGYGLVAPTLPIFARGFDVGVTAASLVVSAFALSRLLFAPSAGRLVGRFGELRVFLAGLLVVAITSALTAVAATYWILLVLRLLGGIGSTMFTISAVSLLVRLSPAHMRGRATGAWATGFLLGNIIGPLVGGGLVAISLRAPFLVYAGFLLVVVVISAVLLRGRTGETLDADGSPLPQARFRDALGHPAYRAALVASLGNGWVTFGVRVAIVPLVVVEALGMPSAWSGIALAVFAAGNAATLVVAGRIADRYGRKPPLLTGLLVAGLATVGLGFVTAPWLFLVVSAVTGLGSGLINPPMNAAVADVIGPRRGGTVLAGFQMASDTGAIIGPVLAGVLAEALGYGPSFAITGAVLLVGFAVWLRAPETLPSRSDAAAVDPVAAQATATPISEPTANVAPAAIAPKSS